MIAIDTKAKTAKTVKLTYRQIEVLVLETLRFVSMSQTFNYDWSMFKLQTLRVTLREITLARSAVNLLVILNNTM